MSDIQLRRLDMTLMLVFASIARHHRLSLVAEELGVTKSAISHALARLRDIFDDELFLRRPTGMQMTPRALALAPKVVAILEMTADTLTPERTLDPLTDRRTLRLGTSEYGIALFVPPLSALLEREAPNMRLSIVSLRKPELLEQIANYRLDLALTSSHGGVGDLDSEMLYPESYVVVARADHPAIGEGVTRSAYLKCEHILVMSEAQPPVVLESYFAQFGAARKIAATLPLYLPAFSVVAQGDRLLTVPRRLAERYAPVFGLKLHQLPFPPVPVAVSLVSNPHADRDPGVAWFRAKVREVAERLQVTAPVADAVRGSAW